MSEKSFTEDEMMHADACIAKIIAGMNILDVILEEMERSHRKEKIRLGLEPLPSSVITAVRSISFRISEDAEELDEILTGDESYKQSRVKAVARRWANIKAQEVAENLGTHGGKQTD